LIGPHFDLPPFPNGWFVFGFSDELKPGKLLARPFMGQEVTIFRTQSGRAYAVDSYCPHLGAHFGEDGKVRGEMLECALHGFQFTGQGACIRGGYYGARIPSRSRLGTWTLREMDGLLLVHHHVHHQLPTWEVPSVGTDGWTRLIYKSFDIGNHPQEITESSVDRTHFAHRNPRMLQEFQADGPHLSSACAVKCALRIFGVELAEYDFEFETQIYGLGYTLIDIRLPLFGVTARLWVLPTPIDAEKINLRLALRAKKWDSALGVLISPLVASVLLNGFAHDAGRDLPICGLSGPVEKYRQWAQQFYC
jgi:nitrite reductase/ring-hydroxylating ferredoxin subunit